MKRLLAALSLLFTIFLYACSDDDIDSITGDGEEVKYTVHCTEGVTCEGANDITRKDFDDYQSVICHWYCADFNGKEDKYFGLTFKKEEGECWDYKGTLVGVGICD